MTERVCETLSLILSESRVESEYWSSVRRCSHPSSPSFSSSSGAPTAHTVQETLVIPGFYTLYSVFCGYLSFMQYT